MLRVVSRFSPGDNTILVNTGLCPKSPDFVIQYLCDLGYSPEFVVSPDSGYGYPVRLLAYQGSDRSKASFCLRSLRQFGVPRNSISGSFMSARTA